MDKQLKKRVRNLKLKYKKVPQPELLIALPNPCADKPYEEEIVTGEFTTLCPLNPGQPDYATITIKYVPNKQILELKSFKFYLTSYRMVEVFFEEATNLVLNDLVGAIKPRSMEVTAEWNIRGGIGTKITASYNESA